MNQLGQIAAVAAATAAIAPRPGGRFRSTCGIGMASAFPGTVAQDGPGRPRDIGHEAGEAELLGNVAWFHALLGDYQQARALCEQSLALIAKIGHCDFEGAVWDTLGCIELGLGDLAPSVAHLELALALCRDHGNRYTEAGILNHVGEARHLAGELPQARQAWQQALASYEDIHPANADRVRAKLASAKDPLHGMPDKSG
jgi:tetratricopeptide (TPR) repeat protein